MLTPFDCAVGHRPSVRACSSTGTCQRLRPFILGLLTRRSEFGFRFRPFIEGRCQRVHVDVGGHVQEPGFAAVLAGRLHGCVKSRVADVGAGVPRDLGFQTPLRQKIAQPGRVDRGKQAVRSRGVHFGAGKRESVVVRAGLLVYCNALHKQTAGFGGKAGAQHDAGSKLRRQTLYLSAGASERDGKKLRPQPRAVLSGGRIVSRKNFYKPLRGIGRIVAKGFESGDQSFHALQNTPIEKAALFGKAAGKPAPVVSGSTTSII